MKSPKHYSQPPIAEALIDIQFKLPPLEEIDYNPLQPKRSERVIMRSQFKWRKKPMPYLFDEERS
ncbi:MAG: hypothetical protein ACM65M_21700 [Microcoleus sp.]